MKRKKCLVTNIAISFTCYNLTVTQNRPRSDRCSVGVQSAGRSRCQYTSLAYRGDQLRVALSASTDPGPEFNVQTDGPTPVGRT
ncbi:hypothetical protein J6590_057366 [Homalodisca vitripennis]|nr:hypothetical protein J6590_057366 [Homalodisca vitripennis]